MKRKLWAFLLAALLLLALAACGGSANGKGGSDSSAPQEAAADYPATDSVVNMDDGGWEEPAAPEIEASYMSASIAGNIPSSTKMIYTADLELESKEFDQASQALTDAVTELGGYFESRSIRQGGQYRNLNCTIRIPAEKFSTFLDRAGELAHVTYRNEYSDNVSEAYYDNEARLSTQRTKLERLQELLGQAEDMADIITIESAISDTELEIEFLTGTLRNYDSLINFSTVNVNLYEVYRLSTEENVPLSFGQRLSSAFLRGFENGLATLDDLVISVARNWLTLLIWIAVIIVIVVIVRRIRRRKTAKFPPVAPPVPPAAPPAAPPEADNTNKKD